MALFEFDPLTDSRWARFLESHPRSSVFHTPEWLIALQQTYRYAPIAITTCPSDSPLTNAIVFARVDSWLTGSKLISLPFSDHCDPLVADAAHLEKLLSGIRGKITGRLKYAEIRPVSVELTEECDWTAHGQYHFHNLDLAPSLQELQSRLHKDSVLRKIRRAERERVILDRGQSELLLQEFYALLLVTRRRHRVPPQPLGWFRNLVSAFGPRLTIWVARVHGRAIASVLTLRHKQVIVYKYGCSDARSHNLGGMQRLFWQVIEQAKLDGLQEFDLGRSDQSNPGLVRFKDQLAAKRTSIKYWRFSLRPDMNDGGMNRVLKSPLTRVILPRLPDSLFRLAGEILYRHAG